MHPPDVPQRLAVPLLWAGTVLSALLVLTWWLTWSHRPELAAAMLATAGSQALFGREAGIPMGLGGGLPALSVFAVSVLQDLAQALLGFGFFLLVLERQRARNGFAWRWYARVRDAAGRHAERSRRYGALGLFVFMLLPFLVNGPLIGAVAGELGGLRRRAVALAVVAATTTSAALWTIASSLLVAVASDAGALVGAVAAAIGACAVAVTAIVRQRAHAA